MRPVGSIEIYDTTLRDGAQAEDVWFSVEDKVRVAQKLDELGVHFIEGGWPGANPKDVDFFRIAKTIPFKNAKLVAFGSTRRASNSRGVGVGASEQFIDFVFGLELWRALLFVNHWISLRNPARRGVPPSAPRVSASPLASSSEPSS